MSKQTHIVLDTDEDQVVLFGDDVPCRDWAERHNGKVVAAGGDPCYVAQPTFANGRKLRLHFNDGSAVTRIQSWQDAERFVDKKLAEDVICTGAFLENEDDDELASVEVCFKVSFQHTPHKLVEA